MRSAKQIIDPALVDEYGSLTRELEPIRTKIRRQEDLAKVLRASQAEADAEKVVTISGHHFEVILGPKKQETTLPSVGSLYRTFGKELFLKVASVTLKALKEHVHPEVLVKLTKQQRIGYRDITVLDREQAKAA